MSTSHDQEHSPSTVGTTLHNGEHFAAHEGPGGPVYKGASFASRISREGAGDLGHQAPTRPDNGFYKHVGNPGLTGLVVHSVTLMSLGVTFMGFRGISLPNYAVGNLWFCAGAYMLVTHVFCLVKGETFSATVFATFGAFYWSYAAILTPAFGAQAAYGDDLVQLNNALALYLFVWNGAFMAIWLTSFRTNVCLWLLFFGVVMGVWLLAGSYVVAANLASQGLTTSSTLRGLQKGGGAFLFISAVAGFYLVVLQMFESVDFPFVLPVGDLSHFWPKKKRH